MDKINFKNLITNISIPLAIGILSNFFTRNSMNIYKEVNQPDFAPPPAIFPIVWTILYILMGISAYIITESNSELKNKAIFIYYTQLIVNFLWPIVFFNLRMFLLAFFWLLFLWVLTVYMIFLFYKINKISSYLQIPYLIWLTFAAFLNFGIYSLNR